MSSPEIRTYMPSEVNMWNVWEIYFQISKHLEGDSATLQAIKMMREVGCGMETSEDILILGSGTGREGVVLAQNTQAQIILLDINNKLLAKAKQRIQKDQISDRVSVLQADAERIPFQENSVSAILAQQVFSQVPNPAAALAEVYRTLKPGGIVIANEMLFNPRMPMNFQEQLPDSIFLRGAHQFSKEYISDLFEESGFQILETDIHQLNLGKQLYGYKTADGATAHIRAFYEGFTQPQTQAVMFNRKMITDIAKFMPFMQGGMFCVQKKDAAMGISF